MRHGWQSESTNGPKGGWSVGLSICLSLPLSLSIPTPLQGQSDNGQCAPLGDGKLRMAVAQRNVIGTSMLMRRHYTDNAL